MKSGLAKLIWNSGCNYRNPSYRKNYLFLKNTEKLSYDLLIELQTELTKETLRFAAKNSEFYREKFFYASFDPEKDFKSLDDLKKIPVTTKEELINRNKDIHTNGRKEKLFISETSGTTGQSLRFLKDENWDSFNRAARARGLSWYGVNLWDRNGYLWGYNFSLAQKFKTDFFDSLQNRFRIFSYRDEEIESFAKKLVNADYLCGYSSMIYEIARRINRNPGIRKPMNLKLVCGTSEKIFESYQQESIKAFGKRISGEYGAAEAGIIAFECPHGSLHINMEGVVVEEEDNEIIVTNLVARSFPVIRYRLGDYVKLKSTSYECPCGMKHRVIEEVLGRVGKSVYGIRNKYPSLTFYYVFKNLALNHKIELNYQAIQKERGSIILKIEKYLSRSEKLSLEKELLKYFDNDIKFEILEGQNLHKMDGKFRDFISMIE